MSSSRDKFLRLARQRFKQAEEATQKQREREKADLAFYAGDQWPEDVKAARQGQQATNGMPAVPARPCLTINKTREPVRAVLNQERASDFGIELVPADDFGELGGPVDDIEIQLREGLIRRIQRESESADARTWAYMRAVIAGSGYYYVTTRYLPGKTFDQEIHVARLYNQAAVLLDPAHEQPDGSDAEWAFIGVDMTYDAYCAEYGSRNGKKNRLVGASDDEWRAYGDDMPGWFTTEGDTRMVRVVEYYYTERTTKTLVALPDGNVVWQSDLPDDYDLKGLDTRTVIEKSIQWAKLDGSDDGPLDETDWPGKYIPIIKVLGEELQPYDSERRSEGMVRPARDSQQGFNYMVSKQVEVVGLTPIPPLMLAEGQDEGFSKEYELANTRALPVLHYKQTDVDGRPAPPPFSPPREAPVQAIALSVQLFNEAIKSTTGIPDATLGNVDPSVRSGRGIKLLLEQAQRGTSNYLDNLVRSMRHEARIINDLLAPIYSRPGRIARMVNMQGDASTVMLHTQQAEQGQPRVSGDKRDPKTFTLTRDAEFNVAIKISKSYDTRREQEAAALGEIIAADPQQLGVIGDLYFKYQDGPGHEEMSERYKAVLVPPVQAMLGGKQQIPPELQQQMAMMQEESVKLKEQADKNQATLQKTQMDAQVELQKAELERQTRLDIATIQANATIAAAEVRVGSDDLDRRLKVLELFLTAEKEDRLEKDSQSHEAGLTAMELQHEREMAAQAVVQQPNGNGSV